MDEDIDVGIEPGVDTSAADSVNVEPLADIPVEEAPIDTMDSLNETEPPISEPELAELQSEAAALAIEPLDEESNSDYFELEGGNSHSLGERIGAGLGAAVAPFAAGIETADQVRNTEPFGAPTEIRMESPHDIKTPEQVLEEFIEQSDMSKPSPLQPAGELAGDFLDAAEGVAEGQRLRDNAEDIDELSTALRKPEYGESSDVEKG